MPKTVDIKEMVNSLAFITMADMQKPININRIMLDDYDGIERDLCIFLVQGYFDNIITEKQEKQTTIQKNRLTLFC